MLSMLNRVGHSFLAKCLPVANALVPVRYAGWKKKKAGGGLRAHPLHGRHPRYRKHPVPTTEPIHPEYSRRIRYHEPQKIHRPKYIWSLDDLQNGPLKANLDWTFADGRPRAYTSLELNRKIRHMKLGRQIIQGLKEVRAAKEEYRSYLQKSEKSREEFIDSKPKEKGSLYVPMPESK